MNTQSPTETFRDSAVPPKDSARGWTVVVAAFVGLLISLGTIVVYSFGVLSAAMASEFQWGSLARGTLFSAMGFATVIGGPLWGLFADRWGGRRAALTSAALLAVGFFILAALPGDLVVMHVAFAALGLIGSGTMPPTFVSVLVGWFDRNRGLALGVAMMSVGLGAAAFPPISAALVGHFGWRMTYVIFGAAIVVIVLPVIFFLLRAHPVAQAAAAAPPVERNRLIRGALGDRRTLILATFAVLTGAVLVTNVSNFVPMLQARGETIAEAARYQSILGISLIVGRILIGGLIDRVFAPYVMMGVLLLASAGFFILYSSDTPAGYMLAAAGIGFAIGAEVDFLGFMVSRYFDRATFATVFAVLFALYALGASVAPPLIGWLAQTTGTYATSILGSGVAMLALALSMLLLPAYAKHGATDRPEGLPAH